MKLAARTSAVVAALIAIGVVVVVRHSRRVYQSWREVAVWPMLAPLLAPYQGADEGDSTRMYQERDFLFGPLAEVADNNQAETHEVWRRILAECSDRHAPCGVGRGVIEGAAYLFSRDSTLEDAEVLDRAVKSNIVVGKPFFALVKARARVTKSSYFATLTDYVGTEVNDYEQREMLEELITAPLSENVSSYVEKLRRVRSASAQVDAPRRELDVTIALLERPNECVLSGFSRSTPKGEVHGGWDAAPQNGCAYRCRILGYAVVRELEGCPKTILASDVRLVFGDALRMPPAASRSP